MSDSRQMPKYKCSKEVWALQISEVIYNEDYLGSGLKVITGGLLVPKDSNYAPIAVSHDYIVKHNPEAGGYYVVYKDGYRSFSPSKAFDHSYSLVD